MCNYDRTGTSQENPRIEARDKRAFSNADHKEDDMNYIIKTEGDADHETQTVEVECSSEVAPEQLAQAIEQAGEKFRALSIDEA